MGVFVLSFCAWIMYEILNIVEKLSNSRKQKRKRNSNYKMDPLSSTLEKKGS